MIYRLRTFGGLAIEPERPGLNQRKRLALLALLANAGESGLTRDKIVSYLWPESDTERARNALYQLVFGIRRELGEDCMPSPGGEIKLGTQCLASDVAEFRQALGACDLERAVAVYAGPFLDGIHLRDAPEFEQWSEATRRELQMSYHGALDRLAAAAKQTGDIAAGVRWTQLRSASEPVSTRAALSYMSALAAAGDRGAALQHAHVHAAIVRTQLDAEPGAEFERFVATLRNGASHPSAPSAAPVSVLEPEQSISRPAPIEPVVNALQPTRTRRWVAVALALIVAVVAIARWARWLPPKPFSTGSTIQLTEGQAVEIEPAISPDGKFVAFAAGRRGEMSVMPPISRIFVKQIGGGRAVPIVADSTMDQHAPRWSPDGSRIAFLGPSGIFVVASHGGPAETLVPDAGRDVRIGAWSPDGRRFAFTDAHGVWIRDLEDGVERKVAGAGFSPHSATWSPDGSLLAFAVGTGSRFNVSPSSIWIVSASGGQPVRVTDPLHLNTSPVFAPDGRSLLFVSNQDGARDVYQLALRRSAPLGRPVRLTTGSNADVISLSADGRHLAYGAVTMRTNVWSAPITPGATTPASAATEVTSGNQEVECITMSRDRKWLVYDSNRNGNQDIYKLPLGGGEPIQLTTDPADDFCGTMSPDDREIAFYSFRTGGRRRIYTMLADGSRQRPAADTIGQQKTPDWSPDGNQIVFTSDRSGPIEIFTIARPAAGTWSAPRQITHLPGGGTTTSWSPDGKYFSWACDTGIMLVPSDSTKAPFWLASTIPNNFRANERDRFQPPYVAWGPDPSVLYYRNGAPPAPAEFWSINIHDGSRQLVMRLDSTRLSRRGEFATDGKHFFFTLATDDANVWLVDLKR